MQPGKSHRYIPPAYPSLSKGGRMGRGPSTLMLSALSGASALFVVLAWLSDDAGVSSSLCSVRPLA